MVPCSAHAPATSERFGAYEIVERLGVGGMAETFVAIRRGHGGFEQRVCLKRILPTFADEVDFVWTSPGLVDT
jgi:hypothetical protein